MQPTNILDESEQQQVLKEIRQSANRQDRVFRTVIAIVAAAFSILHFTISIRKDSLIFAQHTLHPLFHVAGGILLLFAGFRVAVFRPATVLQQSIAVDNLLIGIALVVATAGSVSIGEWWHPDGLMMIALPCLPIGMTLFKRWSREIYSECIELEKKKYDYKKV